MAQVGENLRELRDARKLARDRLAAAFAEDLIDAEELDRRFVRLADAETIAEVEATAADVAPPQSVALARREDLQLSAVLGEATRRGAWTPARYNSVRVVLGSAELDLREVDLPPGETVIDVDVVLGEVLIIAPLGLRVATDVSLYLASLGEDDDAAEPESEARVVVRGKVVLGELHVARREIGESKRDARRRRKTQRRALKKAAQRRALPPS